MGTNSNQVLSKKFVVVVVYYCFMGHLIPGYVFRIVRYRNDGRITGRDNILFQLFISDAIGKKHENHSDAKFIINYFHVYLNKYSEGERLFIYTRQTCISHMYIRLA